MILSTVNLAVGYGSRIVLEADLSLEPGQLTVLIGSNGSGKSTLLRTLAGSQTPLRGEVRLDSVPISRLSPSTLAKHIAVVLTEHTGGGGLRVKELVAIGRNPYSGFFGNLSGADRKAIAGALEMVGLKNMSERFVAELSDGERQKAMIARAIAQQTEVIILDEPSSFLDVASRFEIMAVLSDLAHSLGKAVLLSTHDTAAAIPVADCLWAIADGKVYAGSLGYLLDSNVLTRVFEGLEFDSLKGDFVPVTVRRAVKAP